MTDDSRRVAMITGAAGGLGQALAEEFAERDHVVALSDCRHVELDAVTGRLESRGCQVISRCVDLVDGDARDAWVDEVADRFGRIDVLVNNAAWREIVTIDAITRESWQRTIDTCLTAPAFLSRQVARHMGPGSVVINVSSIMSQRGGGVSPAYVAAKGGLEALTYELAVRYGPAGIRVLAVSPGAIETDMGADYSDADGRSLAAELHEWSDEHIPLGRWSRPAEVARTIAALAGSDASYLTGTVVVVDGGWSHAHFPLGMRRKMENTP